MKVTSKQTVLACHGLGKRFSRNLKASLRYAIADIGRDLLNPFIGTIRFQDYLRKHEFWALDEISFSLEKGDCLGLLGRNGAGKTTLLKILSGILNQDKGSFTVKGRVGGIVALGAGFNPVLSGRENLKVYSAIKGISQKKLQEKEMEIIAFSELEKFIDSPLRTYSSGMQVRLAFSAAAILDVPDVLLIDEVLAVGDIQFIGKCFNLIEEIREKASIILVSHSIANIRRFCNRCCLLEKGKITLDSNNVNDVIGTYVARSASDRCSKDDVVFLNGKSRVKRIEGQTKPRQALKLKFKNEAKAVYAEIVLKKTGNENVLAFYEILEEKLPVVRLKGLDWEEVGIDLRDLPSGNYSFTLSLLDTNLRYLSRRTERCCFCIVNEFESFSPVLRKVTAIL